MDCVSWWLDTLPRILVSSANLSNLLVRFSSMSLMNIVKSNSPSTDPWGMPLPTASLVEIWPFNTTLWRLSWSQFLIHMCSFSGIPRALICWRSLEWVTLSNAFAKSKNITSTESPLSRLLVISYTPVNLLSKTVCLQSRAGCYRQGCLHQSIRLHGLWWFFPGFCILIRY